MKVKDVMSPEARFVEPSTSLKEAATRMREMGCGFLPISNNDNTRLQGVITDRDIVIRAVAQGMDPSQTTVEEIKSNRVLYCYADDDLDHAAQSMETQQVYRLIVLDNPQNKNLCGIVTLGDISRANETQLVGKTARSITDRAA